MFYNEIIDGYPESISIVADIDPYSSSSVMEIFLNDFDGAPIRQQLVQNQKIEYIFKLPKKYIDRIRIDPSDSKTRHTLIYSINFNYKNNEIKNYNIENLNLWEKVNSKVELKNGIIEINSIYDDHYIFGSDKDLLEKNNTLIRIPYIDKFEPLEWAIILIAVSSLIIIFTKNIRIGFLIFSVEILLIITLNIFLKFFFNINGPEKLAIIQTYGRAVFLGESYINKSIAILIPLILIIIVGTFYIIKNKNKYGK